MQAFPQSLVPTFARPVCRKSFGFSSFEQERLLHRLLRMVSSWSGKKISKNPWPFFWQFHKIVQKEPLRVEQPTLKVIPQKLKFPMNFFKTFPECSLPSTVSKKNNKNDRSPFSLKRYDGPILPNLCLYSCYLGALFIGSR